MKIELGGDYLNSAICKDADIVEVTGEGEKSAIEKNGKTKEVYNIPVLLGSKKLVYTPGFKALKVLVEAWGDETKNWIGKKFQVKMVLMEVAGREMNVIRPQPLDK